MLELNTCCVKPRIFNIANMHKRKPRFLNKFAKPRELTSTLIGRSQLKGLFRGFCFLSKFGSLEDVLISCKIRDLIRRSWPGFQT